MVGGRRGKEGELIRQNKEKGRQRGGLTSTAHLANLSGRASPKNTMSTQNKATGGCQRKMIIKFCLTRFDQAMVRLLISLSWFSSTAWLCAHGDPSRKHSICRARAQGD